MKSGIVVVFGTCSVLALGANRDIQFRGVNFQTGVIQVSNYGDDPVDLSGWRFCTQDDNEILNYSLPGGLDGVVVEPNGSIYIHFNDDAGGDPNRFNRVDLGDFALPLDNDAYSLALFFPNDIGFINFNDGTLMADFMQWNIDGNDDSIADERSDEAVTGGVWIDEMAWIDTDDTTTYIRLSDVTGGELHGPGDYEVFDVLPDCNGNGVDDFIDINFGGSDDVNGNGVPDECEGCDADLDGDGDADADDFFAYLDAFAGGDLAVCDIDGDGDCDADDFFGYLDLFAQGC